MNNFNTILKIAWRNIWRQKLRSLVIITAVCIGIWSLIFMNGWMIGISNSYVENAIANELSHLQIHQADFREDNEPKYYIKNAQQLLKKIQKEEGIEAATSRTIVSAMLSTARKNSGIRVIGIQPELEKAMVQLEDKIVEGEYLSGKKKRKIPILISQYTANEMKLKIRSKINLRFQSLEGDVLMGCKVVGIFKSGAPKLDQTTVYVDQKDLNEYFAPNQEDFAHEIAIKIKNLEEIASIQEQLKVLSPNLLVENYQEISPDVQLMETQIKSSSYIFILIIMIALVFGIINTMLMAVLERVRELGMLMAIGMRRSMVFGMIVIETIILGSLGAPLGMLIGAATIYYTNKYGIDLSSYSDAMAQFGMVEIVRPVVDPSIYAQTAIAVVLTAILAAIYPALKAIRLKPVEAIRKI
jgi:putative ABC transport system permease protein